VSSRERNAADPLRLGLVGCGRLAELGYVPALASVPGLRLVAVADPDPDRRDLVARLGATGAGVSAGIATFPGLAALLADAEVDALVLATPTAAHVDDATLAASAGVVALVEKPPAPDAAAASAMLTLTPTPRLGFNRRFDPAAQGLRDAVASSGRVDLNLTINYRRAGWNAHQVRDDALLDLGPHLVDWARWLTAGEVLDVRCRDFGPERAHLEISMTRGRAVIHAATDRPHLERIEARDGAGQLLARHRTGGLVDGVRGRLSRGPHPLVVSLAGQLAAFARALCGDPAADLGTVADGHAAMVVIDAARTSAAQHGRTVPVSPPAES